MSLSFSLKTNGSVDNAKRQTKESHEQCLAPSTGYRKTTLRNGRPRNDFRCFLSPGLCFTVKQMIWKSEINMYVFFFRSAEFSRTRDMTLKSSWTKPVHISSTLPADRCPTNTESPRLSSTLAASIAWDLSTQLMVNHFLLRQVESRNQHHVQTYKSSLENERPQLQKCRRLLLLVNSCRCRKQTGSSCWLCVLFQIQFFLQWAEKALSKKLGNMCVSIVFTCTKPKKLKTPLLPAQRQCIAAWHRGA